MTLESYVLGKDTVALYGSYSKRDNFADKHHNVRATKSEVDIVQVKIEIIWFSRPGLVL